MLCLQGASGSHVLAQTVQVIPRSSRTSKLSIHPPVFQTAYLVQGHRRLDPIPACIGWEVQYTWVHHKANRYRLTTIQHPHSHLRAIWNFCFTTPACLKTEVSPAFNALSAMSPPNTRYISPNNKFSGLFLVIEIKKTQFYYNNYKICTM